MARKKKQESATLTKAEEQVMQAVWSVKQGFAGEISAAVEEPKPAYRTVLSIIRILEGKGFVSHKDFNGNNRYYPLVSKEQYSRQMLGSLIKNYFDASYSSLVSFFLKDKNISQQDLDDLSRIIEQSRQQKEEKTIPNHQ